MINGVILLIGDALKQRAARHDVMTWDGGEPGYRMRPGIGADSGDFTFGCDPGGGCLVGLDYAASARFSFLLATPIIGAAGVLEVPKLIKHQAVMPEGLMFTLLLGGLLAGIFAWLSVWFLMRYFNKHADHSAASLRHLLPAGRCSRNVDSLRMNGKTMNDGMPHAVFDYSCRISANSRVPN